MHCVNERGKSLIRFVEQEGANNAARLMNGTRLRGSEVAVEKLDAKAHNNKGRYFENPAMHDESHRESLGYRDFKRPKPMRLGGYRS